MCQSSYFNSSQLARLAINRSKWVKTRRHARYMWHNIRMHVTRTRISFTCNLNEARGFGEYRTPLLNFVVANYGRQTKSCNVNSRKSEVNITLTKLLSYMAFFSVTPQVHLCTWSINSKLVAVHLRIYVYINVIIFEREVTTVDSA